MQLERLSTWSVERLSEFVKSDGRLHACAQSFESMRLSGRELAVYLQMAPSSQAFVDLECDALTSAHKKMKKTPVSVRHVKNTM